MITEKFTLPIGIEYEGKLHQEVEIRPRLVRDMMEGANDERAKSNGIYYSVCMAACQIIRLGDIPKDKITGALIMDMFEEDFDALMEAANRVRSRAREFRGGTEDDQKADPSLNETGVSA